MVDKSGEINKRFFLKLYARISNEATECRRGCTIEIQVRHAVGDLPLLMGI